MKTGSYFPKSSFGDAELGKNPVWEKLAACHCCEIKSVNGIKVLSEGSFILNYISLFSGLGCLDI